MGRAGVIERVARVSARRPWLVVGVWLVLLAGAVVAAMGMDLTDEDTVYVELESERADQLMDERLRAQAAAATTGGQEFVLVHAESRGADDPAFRALVTELATELGRLPGVAGVAEGEARQVSADGRTVLLPVTLGRGDPEERVGPLLNLLALYDGRDGFTVVTGGEGSVDRTVSEMSERDLQRAELIGLPAALLVLLCVFGAVFAAVVPVAVGLVAIVVAVGLTALLSHTVELSTYVLNMILLIGMAVGVDYSLLVVQRVREERRGGSATSEAIGRAGATAIRSVVFSGAAVIVALCGLLLVPHSIFRSLGAGAIVVVLVAVAAATTLLPAILSLLGDRVNAGRLSLLRRASGGAGGGLWAGTTRFVMRHALVSATLATALLLALALPYLTIRLGLAGAGSLPESSAPYRAFALLDRQFSAGLLSPTEVVISAPDVTAAEVTAGLTRLQAGLADDEDVQVLGTRQGAGGDLLVLELLLSGDVQSDTAMAALARLREVYLPEAFAGSGAEALVAGDSAEVADFSGLIARYTPWVFGLVLGLSFVILLLVFHSIVVPLKAIVMNLLAAGAAYGLMVLVFQHGIGSDLLGLRQVERIDAWVPLFMFAVLFGLSMDYHVFLLSRIRERFEQSGNNEESVAYGVRTTAGMITGAALIMVAVFSGFAAGDLVMFQQMGFGLAVAVLLDATIIRSVLEPASMALLGERNWYLPAWLGWLPRIEFERPPATGAAQPATVAVAAED